MSSGPGPWPLVSVILPTRGRPDLVRAAISSVVGQTYPGPIECLVVHDQEPRTRRWPAWARRIIRSG